MNPVVANRWASEDQHLTAQLVAITAQVVAGAPLDADAVDLVVARLRHRLDRPTASDP